MRRITGYPAMLVGGLTLLLGTTPEVRAQGRDLFAARRNHMVDVEIVAAGVKNQRVIAAMRETPRHLFAPRNRINDAYHDMALPIGQSQTISPPFVVALMTEALDPQPTDKVLEIGTGSGYQAAVLSGLVRDVYTIEIVSGLGNKAARTLKKLSYRNVHVRVGDGYQGWPEHAPFDKIIVTCSPESVPRALVNQLREGGRIVVPVGERYHQTLYRLKKVDGKMVSEALRATLFVPMTGAAEDRREVLPDPLKPSVNNGDFEEMTGDPPTPSGWHYQRQLTLVTDGSAPVGKNYVRFNNSQPGRGCRALQGLGVDGRTVRKLHVATHVSGKSIRPGQNQRELPMLMVTFYDGNRAEVGHVVMGHWRGSFPWRRETAEFEVPRRAREAIIRIGLLGAVGEISFDGVELRGAPK